MFEYIKMWIAKDIIELAIVVILFFIILTIVYVYYQLKFWIEQWRERKNNDLKED